MTSKRSGPNTAHGILLVDKPAGWTSHDVVARVRRLTGQRKAGHSGTLDPMATGLLVVALGDATRLIEYMMGHDKRYEGVIRLGVRTDTDDAEGETVEERAVPALSAERLAEVLDTFTGPIEQRPPAFSALNVGGQRAYALARQGLAPELKPRPVTIYAIDGRLISEQEIAISVHCSTGTYIRSLARDVGDLLGCGGHLSQLRRVSVGDFRVEQALTLERMEAVGTEALMQALIPPDEAIIQWPAAILNANHTERFSHGSVTAFEPMVTELPGEGIRVRVMSTDGNFTGVGHLDQGGQLRPLKVMAGTTV